MAIVELNSDPTERQLRQFGGVCVVALPLVSWLWLRDPVIAAWAAGIGVLLCGIGLAAPKMLKPVFIGLMVLTIPIGIIVGELAMLLIYFGVFLPLAIVFKITGRDAMDRKPAQNSESFWKERKQPDNVGRYYQQW